MLANLLLKLPFLRELVYCLCYLRAKGFISKFKSFLKKYHRILDVGSGTCNVSEILSEKGYKITPLDVQNLSLSKSINSIVYDGQKMPFGKDHFDISLILSVLHHTKEIEKILLEAKRVSKKIIVVEDIYVNKFHKYVTFLFDSLLNLEFIAHPHTNKNDKEWRRTFESLGLKLLFAEYSRSLFVFKHAIYYLAT